MQKLDSLTIILQVLRFDSVDILYAWGASIGREQNPRRETPNLSARKTCSFDPWKPEYFFGFRIQAPVARRELFLAIFLYIKNGGPRAAVLSFYCSFFCSCSFSHALKAFTIGSISPSTIFSKLCQDFSMR